MNPEQTTLNSNSGPLNGDRNELSPLHSIGQDNKGLHRIAVCMGVFTLIISIFLALSLKYGDFQVTPHGSVVSDSVDCSEVGVNIMKIGGNAVDAVIATSFCIGVVQPHLTGLGSGGFLLLFNERQKQLTRCFDFRVSADINKNIGIPGFVAGLAAAHKQHGKLPWSTLLTPAIERARAGFVPSESLMNAKLVVLQNTSVSEWISPWQQSMLVTNPELGDTLQILAKEGPDAFYKGKLISQLKDYLNLEELSKYEVLTGSCLTGTHKAYKVFVPGPGSGGPLLLQALGFLNQTLMHEASMFSVALAMKNTKEVNWAFNSGSHVAVVDNNDLYVSVVSGLGSVFGSQNKTTGGYVLNNALDLSSLGSDNRPTSLSTPVVAVDSKQICGQRNILGGSDARDVAQVLSVLLDWSASNVSLSSVIEESRGRITGNEVQLEQSHIPNIDSNEKNLFFSAQYKISAAELPYPSINLIHKDGDSVRSVSDSRGGGRAIVF